MNLDNITFGLNFPISIPDETIDNPDHDYIITTLSNHVSNIDILVTDYIEEYV